jgi:hypothetical protein
LALVAGLPCLAQSKTDFAKTLNAAIAALKAKHAPQADLPDATSCIKNATAYACEWKSRANLASVTAIESSVLSKVTAALPGWQSSASVTNGTRRTQFNDPTHTAAVSVSSKASPDGSYPWDYTVRLEISAK